MSIEPKMLERRTQRRGPAPSAGAMRISRSSRRLATESDDHIPRGVKNRRTLPEHRPVGMPLALQSAAVGELLMSPVGMLLSDHAVSRAMVANAIAEREKRLFA